MALTATGALADMFEVQTVTDGVYALVGPKVQRSGENLANNATFGVVVTDEGVVLMDLGGSWKGAEGALEARNCDGVIPVRRLKDREKCAGSSNPTSRPTSINNKSSFANRFCATSTRA